MKITKNTSWHHIADLMGNLTAESEAVAMRDILIQRGIENTDHVSDSEWIQLIRQAIES